MRKRGTLFLITAILAVSCSPAADMATEEIAVSSESAISAPNETSDLSKDETPPAGAESEFSTDFSNHTIPYSEVLSGGPPKDGIPAIDNPNYVSTDEADGWLEDAEAVVVVELEGSARAYPVQILMWHEIVNDRLNGFDISVTYCPLCNTAIVYNRQFAGQVLDFGTTGRLRFSNMIMYDRQTETWWQQATGEGIAGEYAGEELTAIPAYLIAWEQFKNAFPAGDVLSRETGVPRDYGRNPYTGYDTEFNDPFLYDGPQTPDTLPPMARVLTIDAGDDTAAFPYSILEAERVVNEGVADEPVVVFWQAGTASPLDQGTVGDGKDVGSASAFSRTVDGQVLTFEVDDDTFRDTETGTLWNAFGMALRGELAGAMLEPVVGINHFWFSWAAFRPETRVIGITDSPTNDETDANEESDGEPNAYNGPVELTQDFTLSLYQGAEDYSGGTVTFSELFGNGRPTVAMFFAGLCPYCRADLPLLQAEYDEADGKIGMVAIDIGPYTNLGSEEDGKTMLAELKVSMPAGSLRDPAALSAYRVLGTPAFLFFNAQGELMRSWVGSASAEQLSGFIDEIN